MGTIGIATLIAFIVIALGTVFVIGARANNRQMKKLNVLLDIFTKDCDPERYIRECEKVMETPPKSQFNRLLTLHNLAMAHFGAGRVQKAIDLDLPVLRESQEGGLLTIECLAASTLADLYLWKDDAGRAQKYYQILEGCSSRLEKRKDFLIAHRSMLRFLDARFAYNQGEYPQALQFFTETLERTDRAYDRVTCNYQLGLIYEAQGKKELAVKHYDYVTENGCMLAIARDSQKRASKLMS